MMKLAFILALAVALGGEAAARPSKRPPLSPDSPYLTGKGCPHGWRNYGLCNGDSCQWANGRNYRCSRGSCVGKGGGDGACCGWPEITWEGGATCPNGGW
ncbi:hypothetical protein GQ607_002956 [Colletotrichum asianum]|uniref:Uncharacterized protein n=1 Tax=Colletotrichum asianum TaxID=702518 RepID=A0A8H3ZS50_9PEZI|nr:hypothetical protein GQ607_002956 [Colletotrichum asianum]